jgi:sarcosine oxidase, subunit beta
LQYVDDRSDARAIPDEVGSPRMSRPRVTGCDLAIIGGGITGLSTAFHACERGIGKVVVYERVGIGAGASGVQPGGVRQQWATKLNCLMARESLAFYRQIVERLESRVDPGFRECGYLFLAHSDPTLERLRTNVELQTSVGVPSRIVSSEEAAEIAPGLVPDGVLGGAFCPEDGYFDSAQGPVEAFAEASTRLGATIETTGVSGIAPSEGGWTLELDDGRTTSASGVVVAAYLDSVDLLRPLGVDLPIERQDRFLFFSEPVNTRLLEPLVVAPDRHFAAKQLASGRLLASNLAAKGDPETQRERWRREIKVNVASLLPQLEFVPLPELVSGAYDVTPDHQAIVGPVPGYDALWVAAGFSGHGFMMAPAVGAAVARMVSGDPPGELIAQLSLERFGQDALMPEQQVV